MYMYILYMSISLYIYPFVSFFSDDSWLFYLNKPYKEMETDVNISLDNIANWLKASKYTLNFLVSNSKSS